MSRSEAELGEILEPARVSTDREARAAARPLPSIERAFRWLIAYRTQPSFEPVPARVTA